MKLSVCIPTYNRSHLLAETVSNIYQSIAYAQTEAVEVIISDNASTDETPQVVSKLKLVHPSLRSYRNETNVLDENFFIAGRLAIANYIWIFGDDDLLEKETIAKVLECIDFGYSHIVLNYSIWDKNMQNKLKPHRYEFKKDIQTSDKNSILEKFGVGLQFISASIFRKNIFFENCPPDYKSFHQYGNSFLLATYASLAVQCNFKFMAVPVLRYRGHNSNITTVDNWYNIFIHGNSLLLGKLKQFGYSSLAISSARKAIIKQSLIQDIIHRKKTKQEGMLKRIPSEFYRQPLFLLAGLPLLLIPGSLFRFCYKILIRPHGNRN